MVGRFNDGSIQDHRSDLAIYLSLGQASNVQDGLLTALLYQVYHI